MSSLQIPIGNFAIKTVLTVEETETIGYAISKMVKNRYRRFPVINEGGKITGMLTSTDIMKGLYDTGSLEIVKSPVTELMTKSVTTLNVNEPVSEAISLMYNTGISGIPILQSGDLVGMITEKDFLLYDDLWFSIPDGMITDEEGVGTSIVEDELLNEDYTLWTAMDKMAQVGQRQLLIKNTEKHEYTGVLTMMRLLDFAFSKLIQHDSNISVLHSTSIAEMPRYPIFQRSLPILVNSVRLWMNARGTEAVICFSHGRPIKLITEKHLIGYLFYELQKTST